MMMLGVGKCCVGLVRSRSDVHDETKGRSVHHRQRQSVCVKDVMPRPQTIIAEASGAESNEEYNQKAVEELRRRILSRGF